MSAAALAAGAAPRPWLGPAVSVASIAGAFVALAAWSFGKWTDVQVDSGVELYVPWQLSEGKALYRDIASRNGPLSHHVNAALFAAFGTSIRTLVFANLAILAGLVAMLVALFRRACDATTATICALVFLSVFAFSQYTVVANYNYVTPYQHAQTHGVALSVAMILALAAGLRRPRARAFAAAGLALGCVFLTKVEIFLPALAAAALAILLRVREPAAGRALLAFAVALPLPALCFFALLVSDSPPGLAIEGVLGNWSHLGGSIFEDPFYRRGMGLDAWPENLVTLLLVAGLLGAGCAGAALLDAAAAARAPRMQRAPAAAGIAGLAAALLMALPIRWVFASRVLPVSAAAYGAWLGAAAWRAQSRDDRASFEQRAPLALFAVFALGLLGKILLHARFGQYGFVLAMPATLLLVAALVYEAPRVLHGRHGGGRVFRALAVAALAAGVVYMLGLSQDHYELKTLRVGEGPDAVWARAPTKGQRPQVVLRTLAHLRELAGPDDTLVVWPEGATINYWARMESPSRHLLFLPTEVDAFGEEQILRDLRERPPDFVALFHRSGVDFGRGPFGSAGNGRAFLRWVQRDYQAVQQIGSPPFQDERSGLLLLRRRPSADSGRTPQTPGS